jgi:hypothetical protein
MSDRGARVRHTNDEPTDVFIRPGEDGYIASSQSDVCGATFYEPGIPVCTRAIGHDGDHVAHIENDTMIARWPK